MAAPHFISIRTESDIIAARMAARDVARSLHFSAIDQARIATAASELARNIVFYAGEGSMTIRPIQKSDLCGIEMIFQDEGPGISNVERFLNNGSISPHAPSENIGLSGTQRLVDEMTVETTIGAGTRIICRKWRR